MKMDARILAVAALVTAGLPATARAQQPEAGPSVPEIALSVDEAVGLALEANEQTRIARAAVDRTQGQIREAFARAMPTIDGSYQLVRNLQRPVLFFNQEGETQQISIGDQNEHAFAISVEQPIFDRSLGAAISAAQHGREASEAVYRRALTDVALATRTAYYEALLSRAEVDAREGALRLAEARLRQIELFHEAGTASEFDLLTAQVDRENERPALIRARNDFVLSRNAVKRVTGLPLEAEVALTDTLAYRPVVIGLEEALARARENRDDLRALSETLELREELVEVARADAYPALSLRFDLTRRASSPDFVPEDRDFSQAASAALQLDLPIFDGRRAQGLALQAQADRIEAEERLRALERDVRLGVVDAWQTVQAAAEAVEATRATEVQARRAYEIAVVRFRNGLSTQLELDEAEQSVVLAELNAAQALHDHMLAEARLLNAMGER